MQNSMEFLVGLMPKLSNLVSVYHNAHFMISLRGFHMSDFFEQVLCPCEIENTGIRRILQDTHIISIKRHFYLANTDKKVTHIIIFVKAILGPPILLVVLILYGKRLTDFEN